MPLDKIIETYTKETGGVKIMDVWKVDRENEVIYKIKKSSTWQNLASIFDSNRINYLSNTIRSLIESFFGMVLT